MIPAIVKLINQLMLERGSFAQKEMGHQRAGITKNKSRGQSKVRRKMTKRSRKMNRV